jgi:hypothetical protein
MIIFFGVPGVPERLEQIQKRPRKTAPRPLHVQNPKQDGEMNSPLQRQEARAQHAAPLQGKDAACGLGASFLRQDKLKRRPYNGSLQGLKPNFD